VYTEIFVAFSTHELHVPLDNRVFTIHLILICNDLKSLLITLHCRVARCLPRVNSIIRQYYFLVDKRTVCAVDRVILKHGKAWQIRFVLIRAA
jgi:hypothetical protein